MSVTLCYSINYTVLGLFSMLSVTGALSPITCTGDLEPECRPEDLESEPTNRIYPV